MVMVIENTSESFNLDLTPISGHPITAVTTWPVAVLAVRHVVLFQLVLHLLLDLDDLPEFKDSSYGIIRDCMGLYGIILDHLGSYRILLDYMGSNWIIWDHLASYWIIWEKIKDVPPRAL